MCYGTFVGASNELAGGLSLAAGCASEIACQETFYISVSSIVDKYIENIVDFEAFENIEIRDYVDLKNHLDPMLKEKNETMYFFFDEIQLVEGWEKVILVSMIKLMIISLNMY